MKKYQQLNNFFGRFFSKNKFKLFHLVLLFVGFSFPLSGLMAQAQTDATERAKSHMTLSQRLAASRTSDNIVTASSFGSPTNPSLTSVFLSGTLSVADPTYNRTLSHAQGTGCGLSAVGTAVHYKVHTFTLSAASNVTISLLTSDGGSVTPTTADTYLELYNTSGFVPAAACTNSIASNDDAAGGGLISQLVTTTPLAAGTYTVVVTSFDNTPTDFPWTYTLAILSNSGSLAGPTVTINQAAAQADPTSVSPINFTAVFSEAVTGFTASDVSLSGTAGATTAVVTGGPTTYNVAVSGMTGSGTVIATIPAGAATGTVNVSPTEASTSTDNTVTYNAASGPCTTLTGTISTTDPSTSLRNFRDAVSPTCATPKTCTAGIAGTFQYKILSWTNPSASAQCVTVTHSTTSANFGFVAAYNGTVNLANLCTNWIADGGTSPTPALPTTFSFNVPGNATISFLVTNVTNGQTIDYSIAITAPICGVSSSPTVTINQAAAQADPTSVSPINFTVVFSEAVTGFTGSDVNLSGTAGATTAVVTGGPTTYNVAVSGMTGSGTVIATIPAGAATGTVNVVGTAASTSTDNTVTYNVAAAPCTTLTGTISTTDPSTSLRNFRDGIAPTCATPKTCSAGVAGTYQYKILSWTNPSASAQCVTVTHSTTSANLGFVAAYNGAINLANLCTNWVADGGLSPTPALPTTFSFNVPGNATISFLVTNVTNGQTIDYSIAITAPVCTGSSSAPCIETFDAVTVPAFPAGWSAATGATCATTQPWKTVNTGSSSTPNSAFTNDPACISDEYLLSRVYAIPAAPTQLVFRNKYILENGFDGMVLEISINGGAFADIITAGGTFVAGGYNGTISVNFSSPIVGRQAWTGTSAGGYITTTVNLPASAQGQNVVFRWRRASDSSVSATGANVDDVYVISSATISYPGSPYCTTGGTATPTITGATGGTFTSAPAGLSINASTGVVTLGTSTAGTYTVTYTITAGPGCPSFTTTASITITGPSATISYSGSPYCSNAGTATVTMTGTAGGTYSAAPAGLSINPATGDITLGSSTAGTYTVTYTIAAVLPCTVNYTTTASVTVTAAPSATIAYAGSPYCSSAGTANVTQTGTAGGTYSSTAGLIINPATGAVTLGTSTPGTYTVTYTVAAAGGCAQYTTTTSVTITAQPAATINYAGSPYCSSGGTANVTQTGTAGGTYSAAPAGLSINASTGAITLGTSTAGTYTVTYTVAAAGGCAVYTTTASVTVTAQPAATIAYAGTPYCSSAGTANVTQTGTAGGTYSSTAGLTINPSTGAVTLGTSTAGTYTVTYTVAAAGGCSVYTTTTTITITAQPAATIAYSAVPYCTNGGTGTVTQTGTTGGTYSAAPAGLSINPTTGTVTLGTSTVGTYTVTYTVAAAGGCSVYTTTTSITINAPSTALTGATASNPNLCTPGGITNLTEIGGVLGTGASYKWYAGSCGGTPVGTGATLTGISVTATTTFYVRAEGICGNTACASVTVTVNLTPTVVLTVASGFPGPNQTNPAHPSGLYATVSPAGNYTYAWTLNGTSIPVTGPSITPANGLFLDFGTYVVTATNTATGCFAASNAITITDIPGERGQLFITPNPAHSSIDIHYYSSTTGAQARSVSIFTATGQRLLNKVYTPSGIYGNMTMDISMLPPGTYIVVLLDGSNSKIASAGLVKL